MVTLGILLIFAILNLIHSQGPTNFIFLLKLVSHGLGCHYSNYKYILLILQVEPIFHLNLSKEFGECVRLIVVHAQGEVMVTYMLGSHIHVQQLGAVHSCLYLT